MSWARVLYTHVHNFLAAGVFCASLVVAFLGWWVYSIDGINGDFAWFVLYPLQREYR